MDRLPLRAQRGAVLVTALIVMLAVLMLGASAARTAINDEQSARYERDRNLALQAAEAALADAERDIEGGADPASERAALLASGSPAAFDPACGSDAVRLGLCGHPMPPAAPPWQAVDLADPAAAVGYGRFTGAVIPIGGALLPARLPRYLIELIPVAGATPAAGAFYRITALGFGSNDAVRVVLQSIYRKAPAAPPVPVDLPAKRISWREVANWPELHQAAGK
jgi:type IV pilus assembly protein PilX